MHHFYSTTTRDLEKHKLSSYKSNPVAKFDNYIMYTYIFGVLLKTLLWPTFTSSRLLDTTSVNLGNLNSESSFYLDSHLNL